MVSVWDPLGSDKFHDDYLIGKIRKSPSVGYVSHQNAVNLQKIKIRTLDKAIL